MSVRVSQRMAVVLVASQIGWPAAAGAGQAVDTPPQLEYYAAEPILREYVQRALERHPGIRELEARHRAALERIVQATAYPDPMVGFMQAIRSPETRVGPQINAVTVSQTFPWFGKRELRGDVAAGDAEVVRQTIAVRRRDVITAVKRAFYDLAYVDAALRITEQEQLVLEQYEQLAASRYAAGQGSQQAVVKLQAEVTKILARRQDLDRLRLTLAARLNSLMDDPPEHAIPPIPDLGLPQVAPDRATLVELGRQHRPELHVIEAAQQRTESSIELARKNIRPDFTLSAGFSNVLGRRDPAGAATPPPDNGKNPVTVSFGFNLPLRRAKYDAAIRQAAETLVAEQAQYLEAHDEMTRAIEEHLAHATTLGEEISLFERALIPQAEEALRAVESAYTTGQAGVLDLLDGERVLLEVRLMIARHRSDYLVALAELERAIGVRFP
jgi:cobalt-zinc-cadmium efflux system outer membrane protein